MIQSSILHRKPSKKSRLALAKNWPKPNRKNCVENCWHNAILIKFKYKFATLSTIWVHAMLTKKLNWNVWVCAFVQSYISCPVWYLYHVCNIFIVCRNHWHCRRLDRSKLSLKYWWKIISRNCRASEYLLVMKLHTPNIRMTIMKVISNVISVWVVK